MTRCGPLFTLLHGAGGAWVYTAACRLRPCPCPVHHSLGCSRWTRGTLRSRPEQPPGVQTQGPVIKLCDSWCMSCVTFCGSLVGGGEGSDCRGGSGGPADDAHEAVPSLLNDECRVRGRCCSAKWSPGLQHLCFPEALGKGGPHPGPSREQTLRENAASLMYDRDTRGRGHLSFPRGPSCWWLSSAALESLFPRCGSRPWMQSLFC